MNTSGLQKGAFVKKADLKVGELYCVTYRYRPEGPCTFAKFKRVIMGDLFLFERVDLPGENSPNFNPYEPIEIGGRAADLKIYKAVKASAKEDPAPVAPAVAPVAPAVAPVAPAVAPVAPATEPADISDLLESFTRFGVSNNASKGGARRRRRTQRKRKSSRKTRKARK